MISILSLPMRSRVLLFGWMQATKVSSISMKPTTMLSLNGTTAKLDRIQFQQVVGRPYQKVFRGKWTVNFDGNDMLGTDSSYNGKNYSVFAVSRQTGGDNERLISSHHNWLFGYHGGGNNRFHFNGWLYSGPDASGHKLALAHCDHEQ